MTVIARDAFTGGDDSDISGRTPDGGGSGPLAVGTYAVAYRVDAGDHLDISSGKLVAPSGVFDTLLYALTGVTIPSADYEVRLTIDPALVTDGFFNAYVGLRVNAATGDGYWVELVAFDGFGYILTLFEVSGGTFTQLDQQTSGTDFTAGTHLLTIRATGTAISGDIDGGLAVAGTDATHTTTANAGLGGFNGDAAVEFRATLFEVDDTPTGGGGTPDPCTYLASRHEFYGPARADVDGQLTDTFPGLGTLAKHPASAAIVAEDGSQGWIVGTGRAVYLDTGIAGLVDGDPVALGDDYCADVVVQFPQVNARNPTGDPPGCTGSAYVERWRYQATLSGSVTEEGLVSDLLGFDGTLVTGLLTFRGLEVWPNGQPKFFHAGVNISGTAEVAIEFFTTIHPLVLGDADYTLTLEWTQTVDPEVVDPPGPDTYSFSNHAFRYTLGAEVREFGLGPDTGSYPPFTYPGGQPTVESWTHTVSASSVLNFRFSSGGSTDVGEVDVHLSEIKYNDLIVFVVCVPATDPGDEVDGEGEHAEAEVLARYDAVAASGYALRLEFTHADEVYTGTVTLVKLVAGAETTLLGPFDVGVAHDTLYQLRLRVAGSSLVADLDGTVLGTVTDATHATGDPGFGGFDDGDLPVGQYLYIEQFSVYNPTAEIAPPCDGPGQPPGTGHPPGPPPEIPVGFWVRRNLAWRFVFLPTAALPSTDTAVRRNLDRRELVTLTGTPPEPFGIRQNLAWRYPFFDQGVGDPPGTGPFPPDYDPCEQLPPTDPPPDVIVGPPPDRLFFAWAISTSQIGPLWTATFMGMGSTILTGISQAAARGGAVFGTPGDKSKFLRGGRYDPDLMDAWIYSLAPLAPAVMAAQAAGSFAGVHAADDWENASKWPPVGLPLPEINRIAAVWKTAFDPGLRVMLRARSDQIGGTPLPNIDGLISQMRHRGSTWDAAGHDAGTYANTELNFCQSRDWILHLSNNVYEGAQAGETLTAAEVLSNGLAWVDKAGSHPHGGAVYGMGIWQFAPRGAQDATGPAYLNAYAAWRNALATLGPPTFP